MSRNTLVNTNDTNGNQIPSIDSRAAVEMAENNQCEKLSQKSNPHEKIETDVKGVPNAYLNRSKSINHFSTKVQNKLWNIVTKKLKLQTAYQHSNSHNARKMKRNQGSLSAPDQSRPLKVEEQTTCNPLVHWKKKQPSVNESMKQSNCIVMEKSDTYAVRLKPPANQLLVVVVADMCRSVSDGSKFP